MKDKGMGAQVLSILRREDMLDQVEFGGEWDDVKKLYRQANAADASTQWVAPDVTHAQLQKLHQSGKRVIVNFSANSHQMDLEEMRAAVAGGADGINVDFPRLGADAVGRPAEQRIHILLDEANLGTSGVRVQAILELSRYRGFPLQQDFARWMLDPNSSVSRAAALGLVESRPPPQLSTFVAALRASDSAPRVSAAWALGVLHGPATTVLPLLNDRDANVVSEALIALAHMSGAVSAQRLLPLLRHSDPAVRGAAAVALAVHQPSAAPAITVQLRREAASEEAVYRRHAATGGGAFTQAEIAELVADYRCQMQMLRALHMLQVSGATRELEAEAFGPDNQFPEPNGAIAALMLWDHLPLDPAGALKQLTSNDTQAADRAEWALINAGPGVLPAVRKALLSKATSMQLRAIRILAWQGDAASLDGLRMIEAGHGPNSEFAHWAIEKIGELHPAL
jgi:glycerophosphoryl diester phosphodiesterase